VFHHAGHVRLSLTAPDTQFERAASIIAGLNAGAQPTPASRDASRRFQHSTSGAALA
jgi:hypothetical protein